ncbi:uncharacterized protein LOC133178483 [Saccostrea echinata]|uniref:uncharacterized protein LOC133178483 n=1 Tax=Saccostrea echinata TaxID=191078 RepID=UPI002A810F26|nr:uncharacterized protein LOC133178483 [Saccostrea echinata]
MSRQIGVKRRKQYDTKLLEEAVMLIKNKNISLNKASEIYSIPKATLSYKVNGKLPLLCKSGPRPVLTENEEAKLADWACKMAAIGFGRTRNELLDTVQKILERDQRPNPFKNNRPGKDWYYAFIKRNPIINERTPQQLAKERAVITPQKVELWFSDLKNYIDLDIKDPSLWTDPSRWFNADESGFPLCPKSGKVLAPRGVPSIYNFTSSDKSQVTVLACMSASRHFLKPLIVFPGQRFFYNPLDGFPEAVMGRTATGWMDKELFYTWMKDVFIPHINVSGVKKPALLLVDCHSTHLTLEGAVRDYQLQNIGEYVTKTKFASVFRNAWMKSTTPDVAVKAFKESGLFPFNPSKPLSTVKMQPSSGMEQAWNKELVFLEMFPSVLQQG